MTLKNHGQTALYIGIPFSDNSDGSEDVTNTGPCSTFGWRGSTIVKHREPVIWRFSNKLFYFNRLNKRKRVDYKKKKKKPDVSGSVAYLGRVEFRSYAGPEGSLRGRRLCFGDRADDGMVRDRVASTHNYMLISIIQCESFAQYIIEISSYAISLEY